MTCLYLVGGFLAAALLGALIIPNILLISYKKRLFDVPDGRKVHTIPVPRLGGLSFFPVILVSVGLTLGAYFFLSAPAGGVAGGALCEFLFLTVGAMLLFLVGVADDLVGVGYRYKFAVQVLAAVLMVLPGEWLNSMGGLAGLHALPAWAGVPFTVFIVVFITNAINLIDGIDGLASGLSCIALAVLGTMHAVAGGHAFALLAFATLGVVIPFWFYNVFGNAQRGHKLFMGDAGSLTLGYILSLLAVHLSRTAPEAGGGGNPGMVLAFSTLVVPLFDVIRVVLCRLKARRNPFLPDKRHLHHKLLRTGMRVRAVLATILAISLYFIGLNALLVDRVGVNWLLAADVASWVAMQLAINRAIRKHERAHPHKTVSKQ